MTGLLGMAFLALSAETAKAATDLAVASGAEQERPPNRGWVGQVKRALAVEGCVGGSGEEGGL